MSLIQRAREQAAKTIHNRYCDRKQPLAMCAVLDEATDIFLSELPDGVLIDNRGKAWKREQLREWHGGLAMSDDDKPLPLVVLVPYDEGEKV